MKQRHVLLGIDECWICALLKQCAVAFVQHVTLGEGLFVLHIIEIAASVRLPAARLLVADTAL
jgi:hypothetical protein